VTLLRRQIQEMEPRRYARAAKRAAELAEELASKRGVELSARIRHLLDSTEDELAEEQRVRLARHGRLIAQCSGGRDVIKGAGQTGAGEPLLLLGLSGENMTRLAAAEPILITGAELEVLGLPPVTIVICYGKTEAAIMEELHRCGVAVKDGQ